MLDRPKQTGSLLDGLIANKRRLAFAHGWLALVSSFAYWIRPGSFTPSLRGYNFRDASPIYLTIVAWAPYVISFVFTRSMLNGLHHKAVWTFIVCASVVTLFSACLFSELFPKGMTASPVVVSVGTTIALFIFAALCSTIGKK